MSKVINNLFNASLQHNSLQINELDRFLRSKGYSGPHCLDQNLAFLRWISHPRYL